KLSCFFSLFLLRWFCLRKVLSREIERSTDLNRLPRGIRASRIKGPEPAARLISKDWIKWRPNNCRSWLNDDLRALRLFGLALRAISDRPTRGCGGWPMTWGAPVAEPAAAPVVVCVGEGRGEMASSALAASAARKLGRFMAGVSRRGGAGGCRRSAACTASGG